MNLTAVIATRNRAQQVRRLVNQLNDWHCEIIVVDDHSQEPVSVDGARVIRNCHRLGGSESWNVGSAKAESDWLLLIADDLLPSPGLQHFIEELLPKLETKDVVGFRIVGFNRMGSKTVKLPYRTTTISRILNILFGVDISHHSGRSKFTTGAMIFHRNFFSQLGGFDSLTYAGNGFREESDLQWRARNVGGRLTYIEDPFFEHADVPGGYQKRHSENDVYYMRNQTIFALRTGGLASPVMISGFGTWLLVRGVGISALIKGTAQGISKVVHDRPSSAKITISLLVG